MVSRRTGAPPAMVETQLMCPVPPLVVYAILPPSGENPARSKRVMGTCPKSFAVINGRSQPSCVLLTQISEEPVRSVTNAYWFPTGDQAGYRSSRVVERSTRMGD